MRENNSLFPLHDFAYASEKSPEQGEKASL